MLASLVLGFIFLALGVKFKLPGQVALMFDFWPAGVAHTVPVGRSCDPLNSTTPLTIFQANPPFIDTDPSDPWKYQTQ